MTPGLRNMIEEVQPSPRLRGTVTVPGDKSISHRALILGGAARGQSRLRNVLAGQDCLSSMHCLEALGVGIEAEDGEGTLHVQGKGGSTFTEPCDILDAGNSGTTMRLLTGMLAAQPFFSVISGDLSLRTRPMKRVLEPLRMMGARIWGRNGDSLAPLAINGGSLHGIEYTMPVASAQVKSAILLAGLYASGTTIVREPVPSRDHTERMLEAMGACITRDGSAIMLAPSAGLLHGVDLEVPGDISSAAYWLVLGVAHPDARVELRSVGANPTRTGVIDVLRKMGANITIENHRTTDGNEPVADLKVESSRLSGTVISGELIPRVIDEIPAIAVAACLADGATTIKNAEELRVKESDRIASLAAELRKLGADIEERPDGMVINGGRRLRASRTDSHGDHRLAMALAIAGMVAEGRSAVEGAEVVGVSYPDFWRHLESLRAK